MSGPTRCFLILSKLEKLVILRMNRDSMVHMRKHYRHLIKNTPSHGAVWSSVWNEQSGKCRVRHPCVRSAWGDMSKASHVGSRQRVLRLMFTHGTHCWAARSRPNLQCVPVSCGCVCASPVASWFAALCVHRGIACGPVPVPVPFPLCCERLTFGNETLGTGSGTCSRSRSVPVFS